MHDIARRRAAIDEILGDPPPVHSIPGQSAKGVWSTTPSCYNFLAEHVRPGSRTLETGLGVSTALFAVWGAEHTCVAYGEEQATLLQSYMDAKGRDRSRVRFILGSSTDVLPRLIDDGELDLVFIDGCHGWPVPIIDWFYAGSRLAAGGILVLDDTDLVQVSFGLFDFLNADPGWELMTWSGTWSAFRRLGSGPILREWDEQPFLTPRTSLKRLARQEIAKMARKPLRLRSRR